MNDENWSVSGNSETFTRKKVLVTEEHPHDQTLPEERMYQLATFINQIGYFRLAYMLSFSTYIIFYLHGILN